MVLTWVGVSLVKTIDKRVSKSISRTNRHELALKNRPLGRVVRMNVTIQEAVQFFVQIRGHGHQIIRVSTVVDQVVTVPTKD